MRLEILYFAAVRELVGTDREVRETAASTVAALAAELEEAHPALRGRLAQVRFAVNEAFAEDSTALSDGDVVALIPPVAGGSDRAPAEARARGGAR